jgi:hypothetical protein
MLVPLRIIVQDTSSHHIFNNFIHLLGLTIGLRMIGRASNKVGAKALMKLFLEMCHKNRSSVRYNDLRNTMIADNMGIV